MPLRRWTTSAEGDVLADARLRTSGLTVFFFTFDFSVLAPTEILQYGSDLPARASKPFAHRM